MSEGVLRMDGLDRKRLYVIRQVIDKKIRQKKAAEILELTDRQVRRMVARVQEEGDGGLLHRRRGKPSNNQLPVKVKEKVLALCRRRYAGFGPRLITEKLLEEKKINISDETIRRWLREAKLGYSGRRARPHRQWRARKECLGEMLQMDGSHHDWLEGRGPKLVLMAMIDDASNRAYGRFYDYEGTQPALDVMHRYIRTFGIPCSIYLDRHTTYKSVKKLTLEEELQGMEVPKSQFERAMDELSVKVIHAYSAPAKGRIERLFRTLQDRLIKEMRLKEIKTGEEANEFLEQYFQEHNRRFERATSGSVDLHRPAKGRTDLDAIFSIKTGRFLRNDFTVVHNSKIYQVHDRVKKRTVIFEEWLDGSVHISCDGRYLRFSEVSLTQKKTKLVDEEALPRRYGKPPVPTMDHPFKAAFFKRRVASVSVNASDTAADKKMEIKNRTF